MRRISLLSLCLAAWAAPLPGAILESLTLDDLIVKSTDIVRARVSVSSADFRGSMIYTHWTVRVGERWKGADQASLDLLIPGGDARGMHQDVAGAPKLSEGKDYLLFLWRARSGSIYVMGLSQGVFELSDNPSGVKIASRAATGEPMLDRKTWRSVQDAGLEMRYSEMTAKIAEILGSAPQGAVH